MQEDPWWRRSFPIMIYSSDLYNYYYTTIVLMSIVIIIRLLLEDITYFNLLGASLNL